MATAKRGRVLIVEDDEHFGPMLERALRDAGHDVTLAATLQAARAALHEDPPDVVIADYRLPDGSGADVARAARSVAAAPPVILLTGGIAEDLPEDDLWLFCLRRAKPVSLDRLLADVRAHLPAG